MTTNPSIPTPPQPRHRRPLAQTKTGPMSDRPLTNKLMRRATKLIEQLAGSKERAPLAEQKRKFAMAIGKNYNEAAEYLGGFRSCPNSEITLRILAWCEKAEAKLAK